ncbi:MAG: hypothetical protein IIA65_10265 [Planctomycetes bacterium]|nr:hypothetical protein [Planctomycetota bacterium]
MKLSDRLVDAHFTKRSDGTWEHSSFPFQRRRIITDEQKFELEHNMRLIKPSANLITFAFAFKWATFFPVLLAAFLAVGAGKGTPVVIYSLFAIPITPFVLAFLYLGIDMARKKKSMSRRHLPIRNAEKGRRLGYLEYMERTGRALGPVYTLLALAACTSGLVFSAILGSLLFARELVVAPTIMIVVLFPLFRAGLRSSEQTSA